MSPRKVGNSGAQPFHAVHKVPSGDGPYGRAKHAQLVEKDPEAAIVWFWKAINAGDRVDSALKDMAVVMKQLDRSEEAIEAIKSFRDRCSGKAQESLDNLLIDLYKKCGMMEEQIELLKEKLRMINRGEVFNGRATKTARSHGRKCQVSIGQETSRILGNLGWAYMQLSNYHAAEAVYRKAQMIDPDCNKGYNLALCLMKQERVDEARTLLLELLQAQQMSQNLVSLEEDKSKNRVADLLGEIESSSSTQQNQCVSPPSEASMEILEDVIAQRLEMALKEWTPFRPSRFCEEEGEKSDETVKNGRKKSEYSLKAAVLGTDDVKAATLIKEKMLEIKAAALKTTRMKAAALEYVKLNL